MPNRTYKLLEVVGVSEESVGQAVRNAIARTSASLTGLGWFEVTQIRGSIKDADVTQFQVTVKIGFRLMEPGEVKDAKRARRRGTEVGPPDAWIEDHF
jgi:flavin-binding protein dodecin